MIDNFVIQIKEIRRNFSPLNAKSPDKVSGLSGFKNIKFFKNQLKIKSLGIIPDKNELMRVPSGLYRYILPF
jgi:hypothetical protein